jgi:hypothetical protein
MILREIEGREGERERARERGIEDGKEEPRRRAGSGGEGGTDRKKRARQAAQAAGRNRRWRRAGGCVRQEARDVGEREREIDEPKKLAETILALILGRD